MQGKLDSFERLRNENIKKLAALGVSEPAKTEKAVKEKLKLAAAEQYKVKAARENVGAADRAEQAKATFIEIAKQITSRSATSSP